MKESEIQILIQNSRSGDTASFARLVDEYQQLLFRLAFRLLCDEEEAKDVVQETFIKIWTSLSGYNANYKFSTWIYKIGTNICYDKLRAMKHLPENLKSGIELSQLSVASSENIELNLINEELRELIVRLTHGLTPKQKLVFTLRDLEGLEIDEIVMITNLSSAKIKSNLYLARKYIREEINKNEWNERK